VWVWQVKLGDPSLTRANLSALEMSIAHSIKLYTNVVYFTYYYFTTTPTVFSTMMWGKLREMFVIVTSQQNDSTLLRYFVIGRPSPLCDALHHSVCLSVLPVRKSQISLRYPGRRQVRGWSQTCSQLKFGLSRTI